MIQPMVITNVTVAIPEKAATQIRRKPDRQNELIVLLCNQAVF
jgi:hypothetical protein